MILVSFLIVIYDRVLMIVSRQSNTEPKIGILIWSFLLKKPPCVGDIHPRLITEGTRLGHPAVQVLCWSNEKTSCRCCTEVNSQGQETRNDESLGSSYRFYHSLICEYLFNMKNAAVYIYYIYMHIQHEFVDPISHEKLRQRLFRGSTTLSWIFRAQGHRWGVHGGSPLSSPPKGC